MAELSAREIKSRLGALEGWRQVSAEIVREYTFSDFRQAMAFVNTVAELAERANHHPDITIKYNRVVFQLATHSEGAVTERDLDMAQQIEEAYRARR